MDTLAQSKPKHSSSTLQLARPARPNYRWIMGDTRSFPRHTAIAMNSNLPSPPALLLFWDQYFNKSLSLWLGGYPRKGAIAAVVVAWVFVLRDRKLISQPGSLHANFLKKLSSLNWHQKTTLIPSFREHCCWTAALLISLPYRQERSGLSN